MLTVVGLTCLYQSQEKKIRQFINRNVEDTAWQAWPDGTIIGYPSGDTISTGYITLPNGRRCVIIPTGDTLFLKEVTKPE